MSFTFAWGSVRWRHFIDGTRHLSHLFAGRPHSSSLFFPTSVLLLFAANLLYCQSSLTFHSASKFPKISIHNYSTSAHHSPVAPRTALSYTGTSTQQLFATRASSQTKWTSLPIRRGSPGDNRIRVRGPFNELIYFRLSISRYVDGPHFIIRWRSWFKGPVRGLSDSRHKSQAPDEALVSRFQCIK